MKRKFKKTVAVYTAAGCGACEKAVLDIHYQVQSLSPWAEVVFWPTLLGSSWADLDKRPEIDVSLFAGVIRTNEQWEAARKLRAKSGILVACGACAAFGGLPGLNNLSGPGREPEDSETKEFPEGPPVPIIESRVRSLSQVVSTDFIIPGCPPTQSLLWAAIQALICGWDSLTRLSFMVNRLPEKIALAVTAGECPPRGSVFAGEKAVCASCSRVKEEKKFKKVLRPYEKSEESGRCLLEQGVICLGLTTREGCGGLCTAVGQPCRGCFGKAEAVYDPGGKMVSAISSTFDSENAAEIETLVESFEDVAGTFYRYTQPTQCALKNQPPEEE